MPTSASLEQRPRPSIQANKALHRSGVGEVEFMAHSRQESTSAVHPLSLIL